MPHDPTLEEKIAAAGEKGAELLVRGYGPEVYGFLVATLKSKEDADDAFATFCEQVWLGLATFRRESTFRTWAYQIARHAAANLRRGAGRRARRFQGGATDAAEQVAFEVRTATTPFLKTDIKDRVRALRDALNDDERELLVLRVDRQLEWDEIAHVLGEASATLRKRFERTKAKLKELAQKDGLLDR